MAIPWEERQRQGAITTPRGTRFEFIYEDLERNRSENASVFRFAEKSGAFIQRLSSGQDIYPLTMIFSGPDYDITGLSFWEKTKEPGIFILEHPRFPGLKRVQLLTIRQRVAAKSADNQTTFDVVLHETLDLSAPLTSEDATALVLQAAEAVNETSAEAFTDNIETANPSDVSKLQSKFNNFLDDMNDKFKDIAAKQAAIKGAFDAQYLSAKATVDNLIQSPLQLAANTAAFISTVSRVEADIKTRIDTYKDLAEDTIDQVTLDINNTIGTIKNTAALAVSTLNGILSAMGQASVSKAEYKTRAEVIEVIDTIIDLADETITILDEYSDHFNEEVDPATRRFEITDATNAINDLTSLVTAQLFSISFTLKQERIIELGEIRDAYTLTHELYGYSEENLQFFIETNNLKSNEIFEIPAGKEIVYYI